MKYILIASLLSISGFTNGQSLSISGSVFDKNTNQAIPQVSISIVGKNVSSVTDDEGIFSLVLSNDQKKGDLIRIRATKIGYYDLDKNIAVTPSLTINLKMNRIKKVAPHPVQSIAKKDKNQGILRTPGSQTDTVFIPKIVDSNDDSKKAARDPLNFVNVSGVWLLKIYSTYMLHGDGSIQKTGVTTGGLLNLEQKDNMITGSFGSRNWNQCLSGVISGDVNGNNIKMQLSCTKGDCLSGGSIIITGTLIGNIITGEVKPADNRAAKCVVYIGKISIEKQ